jgi:hypothetical protein
MLSLQVLFSALKTKSALMQSVQEVMQENLPAALQAFPDGPTGAQGFMGDVGHTAGRASNRSDEARPHTRVPYDSWRSRSEHAGASAKLPSRRAPSGSPLTAADAMRCVARDTGVAERLPVRASAAHIPAPPCRLSRKFESPRMEAAMHRHPQESAGDLVRRGKLRARDAMGDYSRRKHGTAGSLQSHHELATARRAHLRELQRSALGDQNSSQTIARRTIHAEVPGYGGGLWKREDMHIQFTPWDGHGQHPGDMFLEHRDRAPPETYDSESMQGTDLFQAFESSRPASSYIPHPVVAGDSGIAKSENQSHRLKGEEQYAPEAVALQHRSSVQSPMTKLVSTAGRQEKLLKFYSRRRQQRLPLLQFLLFVWRGHVIRRSVLDRILVQVELRLVAKGSAFAVGRECEVSFKAWKTQLRNWRRKKRALGLVHR